MAYILRARTNHTLSLPELPGREFRDGDSVPISKARAEQIALEHPAYRFTPKDGSGEISMAAIDEATAPPAADPARKP